MRHFRPALCLLIALGLSGFSWSVCGAQVKEEGSGDRPIPSEVRYGGVYRAPLLNNPSTLDPAHVQDIYGITVVSQLFNGLVRFSPDLFVVPALAENWQVEEGGKAYRFFLRKNARFHNGRQVTSGDVVFSLSRILRVDTPPTILPHLLQIVGAKEYRENKSDRVAGLQTIDDRTLLIRLDQSHAPFLTALGMYQAGIVPAEEVQKEGDHFGRNPVGSGPFKLVFWKHDEMIRLESFSDHYAGRPYLDSIDFLIYPGIGIERIWADFQAGKLEEMPVYAPIRDELTKNRKLQWVHRPSLSLQFYGINCQHPRLKNRELRKALNLSIDREQLITQAYKGQYDAAGSILPPGLPGYYPPDRKMTNTLDAAVEHLRRSMEGSAGPAGPIEIVSNSQSPFAQAELDFVRDSWARLGVTLEPKFIPDWSEFENYIKSESVQIYRYVWFADIPDPDDFLRILFFSDSQLNYMRYRNDEVDEMLQTALGIIDPVQRAKMYQHIEEKILESSPIIPLIYLNVDVVYQPTVVGIEVSGLGTHAMSFHHVWLRGPSPQ